MHREFSPVRWSEDCRGHIDSLYWKQRDSCCNVGSTPKTRVASNDVNVCLTASTRRLHQTIRDTLHLHSQRNGPQDDKIWSAPLLHARISRSAHALMCAACGILPKPVSYSPNMCEYQVAILSKREIHGCTRSLLPPEPGQFRDGRTL